LRRPLLFGDALLLEGLFLLIPCAQLGGGLIEGKAHRDGDFGRDYQQKDQALAPDIAAAFFIATLVEIGKRLGRCGACVVCIVNDEAARGQALGAQEDSHTRHSELVPGNLARSKHPGQRCQRIAAEAGTCKASPADGGGYQNRRDAKRQPGPLNGGQAVAWVACTYGVVDVIHTGAHKRCRCYHQHRMPQASE
jgi:hypothetical protein